METGRYQDIPREDRICKLCKEGVEDEIHFIFNCKHERMRKVHTELYHKQL